MSELIRGSLKDWKARAKLGMVEDDPRNVKDSCPILISGWNLCKVKGTERYQWRKRGNVIVEDPLEPGRWMLRASGGILMPVKRDRELIPMSAYLALADQLIMNISSGLHPMIASASYLRRISAYRGFHLVSVVSAEDAETDKVGMRRITGVCTVIGECSNLYSTEFDIEMTRWQPF